MNCIKKIFFLIMFAGVFFIPARVSAIEYGGFGALPANPDPSNPRTESIFVYTSNPGDSINDGVRILNNTAETKTFRVYGTDSTPATDGGFACKQFSQDKVSVGNWLSLEKTEVTLDSKSEETINFILNVPSNAEVGEHNGCIMVDEKKESESKPGINLSLRTGLRVAVTVPGEIIRKLEIADFYTHRNKILDKVILTFAVQNTGNVSIDSQIKIPVYTIFGSEYQTFEGQYPILRGDTSNFNYDVRKNMWGHILKAKASVTYSPNTASQIGVNVGDQTTLETEEIYFISTPEPKGLVIEIAILIIIIFIIIRVVLYIKRKRWIKKSWIVYTVLPNEDIKNISQKFNVNWKLLARANKIKAPYPIKPGDKIKVPPPNKPELNKKSKSNKKDAVESISSIK